MKNILVTGGAGFIGSNFVCYMLDKYPDYNLYVYDKLTYAGNLDNLRSVQDNERYKFLLGDIVDREMVNQVIDDNQIDTIVNFAAESHVDRSILSADAFIQTDIVGTHVLLDAARDHNVSRIHQVSTDEVYGSILEGLFKEGDPFEPNSPYAASKAGAELLVRAYNETYDLNTVVTRGSNTFGPYQYPEKIAPLFITNAIENKALPLYGDGLQVRDWLHVTDHCSGIDVVLHKGVSGGVYNLGGGNERTNIEVTEMILQYAGKPLDLIAPVNDRPGHDRRYALDSSLLMSLGWKPAKTFEESLEDTVKWYQNNDWWWKPIKDGEFKEYYEQQYGDRLNSS
ncbi:MAG TPA: dTDP-glucose 4,6-dehydratase [Chloroflexi bacterium]|nr:dTDP-glucose 4,6-dehydratase [Chloroflexota bacterium]